MAVVCVTGAAGFLGSHLVKGLLEGGYKVHGTVRDVNDGAKINHLWDLVRRWHLKVCILSADFGPMQRPFESNFDGFAVMHRTS
jgi:nucleoside-diphosphate-sugar epimerase